MQPFIYHILYGSDSINTKFFLAINGAHHRLLDPVMKAMISVASSKAVYVYLAALVIIAIFNRKKMPPSYVVVFALATLVGILLEEGLKGLFHVPRPTAALGLDHIRVLGEVKLSNSLPSGHATFAAVLASSLGWRRDWRWKLPLWLFVFLVCWSRIYVGAHYPLDVLAGTVVGAFAGTAVWMVSERMMGGKGKKGR